jgi:hypothetical protein
MEPLDALDVVADAYAFLDNSTVRMPLDAARRIVDALTTAGFTRRAYRGLPRLRSRRGELPPATRLQRANRGITPVSSAVKSASS